MSNAIKPGTGRGPERIRQAFDAHKVFIPYVVAGEPDLETSGEVIRAAVGAGADVVEIGIPFSDPTAEGPVIQAASIRALEHGTTTDDVFALIESLRADLDTPFVIMTYANVVFSYGSERFIAHCEEIGVDGLIIPDVPLEERGEFGPICDAHGVAFVELVAPTSGDRIGPVAQASTGFIYVVSSLGVTGERDKITTDVQAIGEVIKSVTDTPFAVGFGISTPEQAAPLAEVTGGVIVGSAVVRTVEENPGHEADAVGKYVSSMVAGIR